MSEATEEVLKFVILLEEHIDVISKSQTSLNKKKKDEAAALIITKWQSISKKKLTQSNLFKKINNLKTRAKSAYKCGKTLNEWQAKLLKLIVNSQKSYHKIILSNDSLKYFRRKIISTETRIIFKRTESMSMGALTQSWYQTYRILQKLPPNKF